jgi:hypothetical protein
MKLKKIYLSFKGVNAMVGDKTLEEMGQFVLVYDKREGHDHLRMVSCPNEYCEHRIVVYISDKTEYVDCVGCDNRIKLKEKGE